jgi:hypothetical protein
MCTLTLESLSEDAIADSGAVLSEGIPVESSWWRFRKMLLAPSGDCSLEF